MLNGSQLNYTTTEKEMLAVFYALEKVQVLSCGRKVLNGVQLNYATMEKEMLAVVYALENFRSYRVGLKIVINTNHLAIQFVLTRADLKP